MTLVPALALFPHEEHLVRCAPFLLRRGLTDSTGALQTFEATSTPQPPPHSNEGTGNPYRYVLPRVSRYQCCSLCSLVSRRSHVCHYRHVTIGKWPARSIGVLK